MKKYFLLSLLIFLYGCSAKIVRTGYQVSDIQEADPANCNIFIKGNIEIGSEHLETVGEIEASDTQFSVDCAEVRVLTIFATEACGLKADIVHIIEESQPDIWSTCYRAKANFLRLKDKALKDNIVYESRYSPELILERSEVTHGRNAILFGAGMLGSILADGTKPEIDTETLMKNPSEK